MITPKKKIIRRTKPATTEPDEISTDDVLRELLELFDGLNLNSGELALRVKKVSRSADNRKLRSHHASVIGDLLTIWNQDPTFLDSFGNPLPIKMKGGRRSFAVLALRCAPNINAQKILFDLKRLGAVRIGKDGYIHAISRSIPVYEDQRLAAQHTLATLHGFIKTLRHNLNSDASNSDQLFHRIAWNRQFDSRVVPRLKIWLKRHGQHFLETTDNWMTRNSKNSLRRNRKGNSQVSVGLYLAVQKSEK